MNAAIPDMEALPGEYRVDMLFPWPSLRRLSHRKVIYREHGGLAGHNVLMNRVWGYFAIEEGSCADINRGRAAVITYDRPENPFILKGLRDFLRCLDKDHLYLGRFYYEIGTRKVFLGYFSLENVA